MPSSASLHYEDSLHMVAGSQLNLRVGVHSIHSTGNYTFLLLDFPSFSRKMWHFPQESHSYWYPFSWNKIGLPWLIIEDVGMFLRKIVHYFLYLASLLSPSYQNNNFILFLFKKKKENLEELVSQRQGKNMKEGEVNRIK